MRINTLIILPFFAFLVWVNLASAQVVNIMVPLSGAQEVPPVTTLGTGTGNLTVDLGTGVISGSVMFSRLSTNSLFGHVHQGAAGVNGPVIIPLTGGVGVTAGTMTLPPTTLTPLQIAALRNNELYLNIHTMTHPGGEIRGQIIFPTGSSSENEVFRQLVSGDFIPSRPGDELAGLTKDGRILVSIDLTSFMEIQGEFTHLVVGDFNGDGMDDLGGISAEDGSFLFTTDLGASFTRIAFPDG